MSTRSNLLLVVVLSCVSVIASPALAQPNCGDSHRFGQTLIRVGDSERRVIERRRPDRQVRLETEHGGAAGYRLDFYERQSTVQVYIQSGVVTRICRLRR